MGTSKRPSYRIEFDQEDVDFMLDYKAEYGASLQWFVEKSVKRHILEQKVKLDLGIPPVDENLNEL